MEPLLEKQFHFVTACHSSSFHCLVFAPASSARSGTPAALQEDDERRLKNILDRHFMDNAPLPSLQTLAPDGPLGSAMPDDQLLDLRAAYEICVGGSSPPDRGASGGSRGGGSTESLLLRAEYDYGLFLQDLRGSGYEKQVAGGRISVRDLRRFLAANQ